MFKGFKTTPLGVVSVWLEGNVSKFDRIESNLVPKEVEVHLLVIVILSYRMDNHVSIVEIKLEHTNLLM